MTHHDVKIAGMAFRCRADATLGFSYADEGARRVSGYNEAELVETGLVSLPDLIQPAEREDVRRLIQDGLTRRGTFAVRFNIFTKDRSPAEGMLIGRGVFSGPLILSSIEGYILRMQAGEREATRESCQLPADLWERMLDHTGDLVAYIDWDGVIRYVTPSIMRILGYRMDQVTGSAFSVLIAPDDRNRFEDVRQRVHTLGTGGSSARFTGLHAGGGQIPLLIRLFASGTADGSVILTASPPADEKALPVPGGNTCQAACAASPVPLIITTREDRLIVQVNEPFLDLTGRSDSTELEGLSLTAAGLQVSSELLVSVEEILDMQGVYEGADGQLRTSAGTIPVHISVRGFDADGLQAVSWSVIPVQAATLEPGPRVQTTNPEISRNLCNRFRNDLEILEVVMKKKGMQMKGEAEEAIRESRIFLSSVSAFYQRITGTPGSDRVPICAYLNAIKSTIMEEYADRMETITITSQCDGDWGVGMNAGIPVGIITTELLINSILHAFGPGESGRIEITLSREEDWFILQVRDSGKGLPDELTHGQPSSAGLAMVENLAMELSGTASFSNERGARVRIIFPDS